MSALPEPTKAETLRGGQHFTVNLEGGAAEKVFVRQLPVKDFEAWLIALDDEPRVAELLCQQEKGWGDRLEIGSLELVVTEGERLNRDFFERWLQRRTARKEWLMPLLTRNLEAGGTSPTTSPNSASKPA